MLPDLDVYGGYDPDEMFPLFYLQVARELTLKLTITFRHLLNWGSFSACWRVADVVSVPKDFGYCRPISTAPILSNVFLKIVAEKSSPF